MPSEFSHLYNKRRWRRMAKAQLGNEPLCAECLKQGIITAATVADHVEPHRGDPTRFWTGRLQSLCGPHHSGTKQQEELLGFSKDIGPDGFPSDRRHPIYKTERGDEKNKNA